MAVASYCCYQGSRRGGSVCLDHRPVTAGRNDDVVSQVTIKSLREVEAMREACNIAVQTLMGVDALIRPGVSTEEINTFVHEDTLRRGAIPAPLNYHGFPKSVCTSLNEVVCHGIPCPEDVLESGDIINVDVTSIYGGFHGDTSVTFYVGEPSPEAKHVTEVSRHSLDLGIAQVREGARLGDIGAAIQEFAEGQGCSVVRACRPRHRPNLS